MKIVKSGRQPVQSMGRQAVGTTGYEGEVAKIEATTKALKDTFDNLSFKMTKRQEQKADLYMQKEDNSFWKQWGGREFFDVSELPEDIVTEGMQVGGRVNSAEVLPQMYNDFIQGRTEEAAKIIEMPGARSDWNANAKIKTAERLGSIQVKANAAIEKQIFSDQKINYANAREARRPDIQLQIADGMNASDKEREVFKKEARQDAEIIGYEDYITEGKIEDMKSAVKYLGQDVKDYESNNGQLDSTKRMVWKHKLEAELNRINRTDGAKDKAQMEALRREIRVTQQNSLAGKEADAETLSNLRERAVAANVKGDLTSEIMDLDASIVFSVNTNMMNKFDAEGRENYIESVRKSKMPKYEKVQLVRRLDMANKTQTALEKSDLMKAAVDSGFVKELTPIDIEGKDPKLFTNQLLSRKQQFDLVEANYGKGLGQGLFTKDEATRLSARFNNMTVSEQLTSMASISQALGPEATGVYQQLATQGSARSFSIAGLAVINGNVGFANHILVGAKYKKENPEEFKDLKKLMDLKMSTTLGSVFWRKPKKQAAVKDAILDAYIGMTGGQEKTIDTGGWFGTDIYNEAVTAATGGILTQGSGKISAPVYGMPQNVWDDWIGRLDPVHIDNLGGVKGMKSSELVSGLQDGDYTLEDSNTQGEYFVMRNNGIPLAANDGGAFIFKFDADAKMVPVKTNTGRGL